MKKLKIGIIGYGKMGKVRHNAVEKSGKAEVIVIFDPKQVIVNDKIKVVYGSRFLNKKNFDIYKGLNFNFRLLLNKLFTGFFNLLYRQKLTDVHTGYKLFKREIFNKINLEEDDFSFCVEVSAKIAKNKIDICEVEIDFFPRSYKEGKKIRNIDGLKALFAYIKYRF